MLLIIVITSPAPFVIKAESSHFFQSRTLVSLGLASRFILPHFASFCCFGSESDCPFGGVSPCCSVSALNRER